MQLGLAAAGPLVDGLRLADGPAHLPNREAPPVWLQWLPRRVYVQKHTRHCALWLYSLFFVVQARGRGRVRGRVRGRRASSPRRKS